MAMLTGCGSNESEYQTDEEKLTGCMSPYDGSIYDLEYAVKKMLRDPDSFEHIETGGSLEGSTPRARMKFRSKNGFGGYEVAYAIADVDLNDCSVSNVEIK